MLEIFHVLCICHFIIFFLYTKIFFNAVHMGCWDGVLTQLRHDVKELLNRCSLKQPVRKNRFV